MLLNKLHGMRGNSFNIGENKY